MITSGVNHTDSFEFGKHLIDAVACQYTCSSEDLAMIGRDVLFGSTGGGVAGIVDMHHVAYINEPALVGLRGALYTVVYGCPDIGGTFF